MKLQQADSRDGVERLRRAVRLSSIDGVVFLLYTISSLVSVLIVFEFTAQSVIGVFLIIVAGLVRLESFLSLRREYSKFKKVNRASTERNADMAKVLLRTMGVTTVAIVLLMFGMTVEYFSGSNFLSTSKPDPALMLAIVMFVLVLVTIFRALDYRSEIKELLNSNNVRHVKMNDRNVKAPIVVLKYGLLNSKMFLFTMFVFVISWALIVEAFALIPIIVLCLMLVKAWTILGVRMYVKEQHELLDEVFVA